MKFVRILLVIFTLGFVFTSCQKDFSYESGSGHGTLAKDAFGDCSSNLVNGSYQKDTLLRGSNYIEVQANFTQLGNYSIKTDTVNGYSFSAVGYTGVMGLNTIRLVGVGKPIAAGVDAFRVTFDTSTCVININVTGTGGGGGGTAAVYTLNGSPTACTAATQAGSYNMNLQTSATNTITITANVTTAGSYSISTPVVNGVSFSGSGTLAIGTQSIILTANGGTPTAAGTFNYAITGSAGNCNFNVIYGAAVANAAFTITCLSANTNGTYQVGTAMTAANTITLPIIVTTPGAYTITSTANGVTFSNSGILTAASNLITLYATVGNIPTASGFFPVTVTFGTANCIVPIVFASAPVSTNFIRANINGSPTLTTFNVGATGVDPIGGGIAIQISGNNNATGIQNIDFSVISTTSLVINTNYTVNQLTTGVVIDANYDNATGTSFSAQSALLPQLLSPFTIRFSAITTAPNRVVGTFSGRLDDGGTGFVFFTNGAFDITY